MKAVVSNVLFGITLEQNLSLGEKLFLIVLAAARGNLRNWTNKAIGEHICVSAITISKYLANLESLGIIKISYFKEQGHTFRNIQIIPE